MAQQAECLLGTLLTEYALHLRRTNYARLTQQAYLATARRFLARFPLIVLEAVTPEHIERHLDALNVSARSREVELEKLRACFKWAVGKRLVSKNPCDSVVRPRWKPKIRPSVTWVEFGALVRACRTSEERVFVETFYFTGLRMRELLSVRVRDLDLGTRRIRVVGKGGEGRMVVFPARVVGLFTSTGPDGWLFPCPLRPACPRDPKWVNKMLSRLGLETGLPYHLTAHLLRHGFFRLLKTRGVSLEVAARLGGHKSIKTTAQIYGRMDEDELQQAYDRQVGA